MTESKYLIMACLAGETPEEIDEADDAETARCLANEYRLAFGPCWTAYFTVNDRWLREQYG